jgi:hypothetical protein
MSGDTRYPCCDHTSYCFAGEDDHYHDRACPIKGCRGSVPVGPTKEGKQ